MTIMDQCEHRRTESSFEHRPQQQNKENERTTVYDLLKAQTTQKRAPIHLLNDLPANISCFSLPPEGCMAELSGASGTGKTQIAVNLCRQVSLEEGYAIFIGSKSSAQVSQFSSRADQMGANLQLILTRVARTPEQLESVLKEIPALLAELNVRLLVVDSIADLFRQEETFTRAGRLLGLAALLGQWKEEYGLSTLVINQLSFDRPALGPTWAHAPQTRYRLFHQDGRRRLQLESSHRYARNAIDWEIKASGAFAVGKEYSPDITPHTKAVA